MAAHGNRWQCFVFTQPTGEDVAHLVNINGTVDLFTHLDKPVAYLTVAIGQGQPTDAALSSTTELRRFHDGVP